MPKDPRLLVGTATSDDAGVYLLNPQTALIQTLDFFTPMVDDPFAFGQIAAANALSDVYAMGGQPLLCMNILACPGEKMGAEVFHQVLAGGLSKIKEAGALLVGGHSVEDAELKYGLSVTGVVHPDNLLTNAGAHVGDVLVLTKPLGTGILATALKGGLLSEDALPGLTQVMTTLNKLPLEVLADASFAPLRSAVHACTDITGFGLLGHAHEMAQASQVSLHFMMATLPLLPGVLDLVNMGIIPEGTYRNKKYYAPWLHSTLAEDGSVFMLGFDPQTSGGLLFSLSEQAAQALLAGLKQRGYPFAARIVGIVQAGEAGKIFAY